MLKTQPTIAQIDEVTAFLPMLYGEDAEPFVAESKCEASDVIVLSGPEYSKAVLDFLSLVSRMGKHISMRRKKFRSIQSALERYIECSPPLWK